MSILPALACAALAGLLMGYQFSLGAPFTAAMILLALAIFEATQGRWEEALRLLTLAPDIFLFYMLGGMLELRYPRWYVPPPRSHTPF